MITFLEWEWLRTFINQLMQNAACTGRQCDWERTPLRQPAISQTATTPKEQVMAYYNVRIVL